MLSHVGNDGSECPISFASRTLTKAEVKYSQLERESLSIVFGISKFHDYLWGHHFVIETNHQPLVKIFGEHSGIPTIASSRLQRWALKLAAHSYTVVFKKGINHSNADLLSRLLSAVAEPSKLSEGSLVQTMRVSSLPVTADEVARVTRLDKQLSRVLHYTRHGWPELVENEIRPFLLKQDYLTIEQDVLLLGIRVVVPELLRDRVLEQLHDTHPGIARMKGIARSHVWWPELDHDIEYVVKGCTSCQLQQSTPTEAMVHPLVWP